MGVMLQALVLFEEVLGMEPPNYLGDDFSRITQIYRVSQYNISCCYSAMNQVSVQIMKVMLCRLSKLHVCLPFTHQFDLLYWSDARNGRLNFQSVRFVSAIICRSYNNTVDRPGLTAYAYC